MPLIDLSVGGSVAPAFVEAASTEPASTGAACAEAFRAAVDAEASVAAGGAVAACPTAAPLCRGDRARLASRRSPASI